MFYSESSGSLLVREHSNSRVYNFYTNSCRLIKKNANTLHLINYLKINVFSLNITLRKIVICQVYVVEE